MLTTLRFLCALSLMATMSSVEPYVDEAPLPQGWPTPGEPGVIELVDLPAHRAAEGPGFWPLFQHIQSAGIPMTSPVTMPASAGGRRGAGPMRFLYPGLDTAAAPAAAGVRVVTIEAATVLRICHRGSISEAVVADLTQRLNAHATVNGLTVAGQALLFGYNSPMLPAARQTWELALPIIQAD